jgi:UPF0271 protein
MNQVDLNCDLGELEGEQGLQQDAVILQFISSANVACGAHAGSVHRMRQLAILCRDGDVAFGAHPGYPDRARFGREPIEMTPQQIRDMVRDQVRLAAKIADEEGIVLTHVKPHGALYNLAAGNADVADAVSQAVKDACPQSLLIGLSGSQLIRSGDSAGLMTRNEVFADRHYHSDGSLVSRQNPVAVLRDPEQIAHRAVRMIREQSVMSVEGVPVSILAETICVHGDAPHAVEIIQRLRRELELAEIQVRKVDITL